jgi:hypothetical protein
MNIMADANLQALQSFQTDCRRCSTIMTKAKSYSFSRVLILCMSRSSIGVQARASKIGTIFSSSLKHWLESECRECNCFLQQYCAHGVACYQAQNVQHTTLIPGSVPNFDQILEKSAVNCPNF